MSPLGFLKHGKSGEAHSDLTEQLDNTEQPRQAGILLNTNTQQSDESNEVLDSPSGVSQDGFSRTNTSSSSGTNISDKHGSHKHHRFSFGHHSSSSVSKDPSLISTKSRTSTLPPPFEKPYDLEPIGLAQLGLSTCLTIPGYDIEELRTVILPQLFHVQAYQHRVNCRETNADGLLEIIKFLRTKFSKMRIRFKADLMDQDGTATMKAAAVALQYDLIGERIDDPHPKHEQIERRTQAYCMSKIFEGKIAQTDIVIDTQPLQPTQKPTELSCVVC